MTHSRLMLDGQFPVGAQHVAQRVNRKHVASTFTPAGRMAICRELCVWVVLIATSVETISV